MTRPLRSVFEPGTTLWALRRAQWSALGIPQTEDRHREQFIVVGELLQPP